MENYWKTDVILITMLQKNYKEYFYTNFSFFSIEIFLDYYYNERIELKGL